MGHVHSRVAARAVAPAFLPALDAASHWLNADADAGGAVAEPVVSMQSTSACTDGDEADGRMDADDEAGFGHTGGGDYHVGGAHQGQEGHVGQRCTLLPQGSSHSCLVQAVLSACTTAAAEQSAAGLLLLVLGSVCTVQADGHSPCGGQSAPAKDRQKQAAAAAAAEDPRRRAKGAWGQGIGPGRLGKARPCAKVERMLARVHVGQ